MERKLFLASAATALASCAGQAVTAPLSTTSRLLLPGTRQRVKPNCEGRVILSGPKNFSMEAVDCNNNSYLWASLTFEGSTTTMAVEVRRLVNGKWVDEWFYKPPSGGRWSKKKLIRFFYGWIDMSDWDGNKHAVFLADDQKKVNSEIYVDSHRKTMTGSVYLPSKQTATVSYKHYPGQPDAIEPDDEDCAADTLAFVAALGAAIAFCLSVPLDGPIGVLGALSAIAAMGAAGMQMDTHCKEH